MVKRKILGVVICVAVVIVITIGVIIGLVVTKKGKDEPQPVVTTHCGNVSGTYITTTKGTKIATFKNIPYAVPPLKERRWEPSRSMSKDEETCWSGTFYTNYTEVIKCVQGSYSEIVTVDGQEDCLALSVRSPNLTGSLPVLVWIHGGGLYTGYGEALGYSADEDFTEDMEAVTVNVNYRLGVMGFVSIKEMWNETSKSYANFGLTDLVTALQWIKENIANFGGNPDSITLIGESGGGTAILGLISSPLANNLFHRAIPLSPAPVWRTNYTQANEEFGSMVKAVGCDQSTTAERLICMESQDIKTLSLIGQSIMLATKTAYFDFPMTYGKAGEVFGLALIDPTVVPQAPADLANATFTPKKKVKIILSNLSEENAADAIRGLNIFTTWEAVNTALKARLTNIFGNYDLLSKIWEIYSNSSSTWTPQQAWDTIGSDLRSTCPINDLAALMAKSDNHELYRLYITHRMSDTMAFHGWDAYALFNFKTSVTLIPHSPHNKYFRSAIQAVVKDFINDNITDGWKTYPTNIKVLGNSSPYTSVKTTKPQATECQFWNNNNMSGYGCQG